MLFYKHSPGFYVAVNYLPTKSTSIIDQWVAAIRHKAPNLAWNEEEKDVDDDEDLLIIFFPCNDAL